MYVSVCINLKDPTVGTDQRSRISRSDRRCNNRPSGAVGNMGISPTRGDVSLIHGIGIKKKYSKYLSWYVPYSCLILDNLLFSRFLVPKVYIQVHPHMYKYIHKYIHIHTHTQTHTITYIFNSHTYMHYVDCVALRCVTLHSIPFRSVPLHSYITHIPMYVHTSAQVRTYVLTYRHTHTYIYTFKLMY